MPQLETSIKMATKELFSGGKAAGEVRLFTHTQVVLWSSTRPKVHPYPTRTPVVEGWLLHALASGMDAQTSPDNCCSNSPSVVAGNTDGRKWDSVWGGGGARGGPLYLCENLNEETKIVIALKQLCSPGGGLAGRRPANWTADRTELEYNQYSLLRGLGGAVGVGLGDMGCAAHRNASPQRHVVPYYATPQANCFLG
jgi:hypothetical protein